MLLIGSVFGNPHPYLNADALSRLPLEDTIEDPPLPAETVLLMEQMDELPVTSCQVKTWTCRDPILSQNLQYVQQGWPAHLMRQDEEQLKPYWRRRWKMSYQDGC